MAVAGYLDKYFECVECLPLDLQRYVTQLREVENEARGVVGDLRALQTQLSLAIEDGDAVRQQVVFRQLQQCLVNTRNYGNQKLEISAKLLETVEDYGQQLGQKRKAMDNSSIDEFYHPQRITAVANSNHLGSKDNSSVLNNGPSETKTAIKKNSGTKRIRPPPMERDEDTPPISNGRSRDSSTPSTSSITNNGNGRSTKKKVKTVKKKSAVMVKVPVATEKESPPPLPPTAHVPMPDLTSQPLDPDEPTYCLCQQVSFGEMIGCDNDDCPIEWFHFQCVNLTSKPKGRWFCPQCSQGRRGSKPTK